VCLVQPQVMLDEPFRHQRAGVQEDDQRRGRPGSAQVASGRSAIAEIFLEAVAHGKQLREVLDHLGGLIGGPVVRHDHLEGADRHPLGGQCGQLSPQQAGAVVRRDDHRCVRCP
jgi:hypothetical protein